MSEEVIARPCAGVMLRNDAREVLLIRRASANRCGIPGDGLEPGESWVDAALRECREETGWLAHIDGLLGIYSNPATQGHLHQPAHPAVRARRPCPARLLRRSRQPAHPRLNWIPPAEGPFRHPFFGGGV